MIMDKKDYKKLDDDQIVAILDQQIRQSVGYSDSKISRERKEVMDHYNAELPKPTHTGNSKYVSQDVYDTVESAKATLLETFAVGQQSVRFAPQGPEDVGLAQIATVYCDYVAYQQNDLFSIKQSLIHDGLTARAGISKVYWMVQEESSIERIDGLTAGEFDSLIAQDGVQIDEITEDELGLYSGTLRVFTDTSKICIEAIPPEEFVIEAQAKSLEDAKFCAHVVPKTLSELREMGYSEKLISKIGTHEHVEMETSPEVLARHGELGTGATSSTHGYQDQVRSVQVHEAFILLDCEGSGIADLYRVVKAGNVLLEKDIVNRKPFIPYVPLPTPHNFWGDNFAARVKPTQNAKSVLTRSILDHAVITNVPRYKVVKGALPNPKEIIESRTGGLVNVTRPDAITPLEQAPLNPFVFQTIKMLDEDKEDNTGVSRLSQGLNKDAVSKQNSAEMVDQLATMSQQRQKIMARNFANNFLKPLYRRIYELAIENVTGEQIIEVAGNYVPVTPSEWRSGRDVVVEMHLGGKEKERSAQMHLSLHQILASDPVLSTMYTPQNRYQLMSHVLENNGIKNIADYLTPPEQLPDQNDPAQQMQMQMAMKQMEIQERQTSIAEIKAQTDSQIAAMKLELDKLKADRNFAIQSDGMDLKEAQLEHKQFVDNEELEIARNTDDVRAIASPTG